MIENGCAGPDGSGGARLTGRSLVKADDLGATIHEVHISERPSWTSLTEQEVRRRGPACQHEERRRAAPPSPRPSAPWTRLLPLGGSRNRRPGRSSSRSPAPTAAAGHGRAAGHPT